MGQRESILCSELPSRELPFQPLPGGAHLTVLHSYEEKHDITILDPPDFENVVKQSESHPDLALDPENLFQFLSSVGPFATVALADALVSALSSDGPLLRLLL